MPLCCTEYDTEKKCSSDSILHLLDIILQMQLGKEALLSSVLQRALFDQVLLSCKHQQRSKVSNTSLTELLCRPRNQGFLCNSVACLVAHRTSHPGHGPQRVSSADRAGTTPYTALVNNYCRRESKSSAFSFVLRERLQRGGVQI